MSTKIILNVGANRGQEAMNLFLKDTSNIVYAFEPTPQLLGDFLFPMQFSFHNFKVIPCAVSDFNGFAPFNIAGQSDWGCSSLNTFNDNLDQTWPGRLDFIKTEEVIVPVIRMDFFLESMNIDVVDYMYCDSQGSDLKVLKSFGKKITCLSAGVVEAFNKNPLYKESDNYIDDVINFLTQHGFTNITTKSNDGFNNEINVYFAK